MDLRSEIDKDRRQGRFLILGSASRDLIKQSTESLAGRIAYIDLTPFIVNEVVDISIKPKSAWVIAPVDELYKIKKGIFVCPPAGLEI